MHSQTKTVLAASIAGLVLAVSTKASSVISTGQITPLDTFNPFNPTVLGYWIGTLGFFPLFSIAFAIAATARTAGPRNSILNGLGAVIGVVLAITGAVIAVATAHPNKEFPDRASFVKKATSSCFKNQQAPPGKKAVSAAIIEAFCSCYGDSLADVTTTTEMAYADQHQTFAPTTIEKINATVQKCGQLVPDLSDR